MANKKDEVTPKVPDGANTDPSYLDDTNLADGVTIEEALGAFMRVDPDAVRRAGKERKADIKDGET